MKKTAKLFLVFVIVFLLAGCAYSPKENDIVLSFGGVENIDLFYGFLEKIQNGEPNEIRIVEYTNEGDPIIHDVVYDGEKFISDYNKSYDAYGAGGPDIITIVCKSLNEQEKEDFLTYTLSDCNKEKVGGHLLTIHKMRKQQKSNEEGN